MEPDLLFRHLDDEQTEWFGMLRVTTDHTIEKNFTDIDCGYALLYDCLVVKRFHIFEPGERLNHIRLFRQLDDTIHLAIPGRSNEYQFTDFTIGPFSRFVSKDISPHNNHNEKAEHKNVFVHKKRLLTQWLNLFESGVDRYEEKQFLEYGFAVLSRNCISLHQINDFSPLTRFHHVVLRKQVSAQDPKKSIVLCRIFENAHSEAICYSISLPVIPSPDELNEKEADVNKIHPVITPEWLQLVLKDDDVFSNDDKQYELKARIDQLQLLYNNISLQRNQFKMNERLLKWMEMDHTPYVLMHSIQQRCCWIPYYINEKDRYPCLFHSFQLCTTPEVQRSKYFSFFVFELLICENCLEIHFINKSPRAISALIQIAYEMTAQIRNERRTHASRTSKKCDEICNLSMNVSDIVSDFCVDPDFNPTFKRRKIDVDTKTAKPFMVEHDYT